MKNDDVVFSLKQISKMIAVRDEFLKKGKAMTQQCDATLSLNAQAGHFAHDVFMYYAKDGGVEKL